MTRPLLHDAACVVHLHSTYSDGTGAVPEIAAAARAGAVDVVLLTDHDTLEAKRRGEEGWHGSTLVLVGEEVSPKGRDHLLAFGVEEVVRRKGRTPEQMAEDVRRQGGVCFAAHPFSEGSPLFSRATPIPYEALDADALTGLELWSLVNDTGQKLRSYGDVARFLRRPETMLDHPPERNMREWDRLCASRPMVAIGGIDAHQVGKRVPDSVPLIGGSVPLRLMSYRRSFRFLRTHVLCAEQFTGELEHDRTQVYEALRDGRCYLAMDWIAPARGFSFWAARRNESVPMGSSLNAGRWTLRASVPRPALLRLLRDGELLLETEGGELERRVQRPGAYRVEARVVARGRARTWIVSNPIYLR